MEHIRNPNGGSIESFADRIIQGNADALGELGAQYPDLAASLETLTNPSVSRESFFEAIAAFNDAHMREKAGISQMITFRGDHGDISVKHYQNGSASISASWQE